MKSHTPQGQQRRKREEEALAKSLTKAGILFDREVSIDFSCGLGNDRAKKSARVDFVVQRPCPSGVITFYIEVDEREHSDDAYLLSCECRRMMDVHSSVLTSETSTSHAVWLRFNPHAFRVDGMLQKVPKPVRYQQLHQIIQTYEPHLLFEIWYLCYTMETQGERVYPIIFNDPQFPDAMKSFAYAVPPLPLHRPTSDDPKPWMSNPDGHLAT